MKTVVEDVCTLFGGPASLRYFRISSTAAVVALEAPTSAPTAKSLAMAEPLSSSRAQLHHLRPFSSSLPPPGLRSRSLLGRWLGRWLARWALTGTTRHGQRRPCEDIALAPRPEAV